jgi:hypothetical protein
MKQIVDLEGSPDFQSLDVALVSIAIDPVADLSLATSQYGINTPLACCAGLCPMANRATPLSWWAKTGKSNGSGTMERRKTVGLCGSQ